MRKSKVVKQQLVSLSEFAAAIMLAGCESAPTLANSQPVATPVPQAAAPEVAIEAVSPSAAYSRSLHGVFIKTVVCTPTHLRLGDSIDVTIQDAWLERLWEPKSGGLFGKPDFGRGYALDSTSDTPRSQLVLAIAPTSRLGHFDTGSWRINLSTDIYKEHGFDRSRGNQLVMYFVRSNAVFPLKFYLYTYPKPCTDCQPPARDSLVIYE